MNDLDVARTLQRWSARPGLNGVSGSPDHVVLVPPRGDLARGFEEAQRLLDGGEPVRLVGHGASLAHTWPAWAAGAKTLWLTELGAYALDSPVESTRPLREALARWTDRVLGDAVPGAPGGGVFYSSASARVFQPLLDAAPLVAGLARAHPLATFHCVDPNWAGLPMLADALAETGGRVGGLAASARGAAREPPGAWLAWLARFAGTTAFSLAGSVGLQVRDFVQAARGRAALRGRAREAPGGARPDVWVAVVADWFRMNRHLIDAFVLPELARGTRLGVLLLGRLAPGARLEANLARREGDALWTGLGDLQARLSDCALDQLVAPETVTGLLRCLASGGIASVRAALRVAAGGGVAEEPPLRLDLSGHVWGLAKLLTVDVGRAIAAAHAARRVAERHDLRNACVVFASSTMADTSAADLTLQAAGANTLEYYHGAGMEGWIGAQESRARYRCRYTRADARTAEAMGLDAIVAGMPVRSRPAAQKREGEPRVLLLTNYVHRDHEVDGRFPFEPFQEEVLGLVPLLERGKRGVRIRWRPHPADNPEAVARGLARVPGVERSPSASIEEDLAWCDLAVSTMSTTVLESLFAGVPVFVHVPPEFRDGPNATFVDQARVFFRAAEGAPAILAALAALARAEPGLLEPEARARVAFFGEGGEPRSLGDALREARLVPAQGRVAAGGMGSGGGSLRPSDPANASR